MKDGPFTLPDGRPLDDAEPQDIAREVARTFDLLSRVLDRGGPLEAERAGLVETVMQIGAIMRRWAAFGRWKPRRFELAEKAARKIKRGHLRALRFASEGSHVDEELRALPDLLEDLLRHLAPEGKR